MQSENGQKKVPNFMQHAATRIHLSAEKCLQTRRGSDLFFEIIKVVMIFSFFQREMAFGPIMKVMEINLQQSNLCTIHYPLVSWNIYPCSRPHTVWSGGLLNVRRCSMYPHVALNKFFTYDLETCGPSPLLEKQVTHFASVHQSFVTCSETFFVLV